MNKLLLLLSLIGLASCQPEDQPNDVAARAAGRFAVQQYVVNGDTLYSTRGINKIDVSEFYIIVDRKKPDSVRVGSFHKKTGAPGAAVFIKDVGVSETNSTFQLSTRLYGPAVYESSIEGNIFYERTARGGPGDLILPPSYTFPSPANPALEGVIIVAQK